jgi:poly(hydroxyalkanoate) depolymerase family esterase
MRDSGKAMAHLQVLRHKFEDLLDIAQKKKGHAGAVPAHEGGGLRELTGFGANPGNLRMFVHAPQRLPPRAPLVVALHGCSQSAEEYDVGTGWSSLADRFGFAVVYPQQQPANNPKNCFSWFLPGDTARDHGEARSIREMVAHAGAAFGADPHRVFVTGLSAGGAMASAMLASYPEVFAGGAIIAGLPYGCARSVQQAFEAMFTEQARDGSTLGDYVRAASKHRGPWPRISIWHGTADPIVKASNADDIVRQWIDVHALSAIPPFEETIGRHTRRVWIDTDGEPLIEAFSISGMAHGVPLAPTSQDNCGAAGAFFLDAGISSTQHIAGFWRLGERSAELSRPDAMVPKLHEPPTAAGGAAVAAATIAKPGDAFEASFAAGPETDASRALALNQVIAAAFKAAGLPIPKVANAPSGAPPQFTPGPIIRAALKAAGLTRT